MAFERCVLFGLLCYALEELEVRRDGCEDAKHFQYHEWGRDSGEVKLSRSETAR